MPLSTFATTCGPPCRRTYTETFFVWPVLPLPHPTYMRSQGRSRLALLSFSVFLSSLLSPSPNPNPATRVGGGAGESARRRRRRRLCRLDGGCATCAGGDSCLEQVVVVKEIWFPKSAHRFEQDDRLPCDRRAMWEQFVGHGWQQGQVIS